MEETFGERSEKVILYEKLFEGITLTSQSITSFSTSLSHTVAAMSDHYPDVTRAITFTFPSPIDNPDTIIFEFSDHYRFSTRSSKTCDGSKTCYVYEDPVNWVVYKPSAIANGANIILTITDWTTLYYADDVTYTVRIQKNNVV